MPRPLPGTLRFPAYLALLTLVAGGASMGIQTWGIEGTMYILVGGQMGALAAAIVHTRREHIEPIGAEEADAWHARPGEVEECRGWKTATIGLQDGEVLFTGVFKGTYGAEAVATCELGKDHPAPRADCTCGFHVYHEKERARRKQRQCATSALLEVELYGTVVEHEYGARGEEQSILAVHVDPRCTRCTRRAAGLVAQDRREQTVLVPSCERCSCDRYLWTLPELAQKCGTEVRWGELPPWRQRVREALSP